jgi:hypothetical protein
MRVQDQDKSNCDLACMTSFGGKANWSRQKKKSLKKRSWFGESNHKLRSKVAPFFVFK